MVCCLFVVVCGCVVVRCLVCVDCWLLIFGSCRWFLVCCFLCVVVCLLFFVIGLSFVVY